MSPILYTDVPNRPVYVLVFLESVQSKTLTYTHTFTLWINVRNPTSMSTFKEPSQLILRLTKCRVENSNLDGQVPPLEPLPAEVRSTYVLVTRSELCKAEKGMLDLACFTNPCGLQMGWWRTTLGLSQSPSSADPWISNFFMPIVWANRLPQSSARHMHEQHLLARNGPAAVPAQRGSLMAATNGRRGQI